MAPVNPTEAGREICGLRVYESLAAIDRPVDMVEVFRNSAALPGIAREAIDIGAKALWAQLGVRNDEAARLAEAAGLKVVMNRCPKIELFRPFWKPRLKQAISLANRAFFMLCYTFSPLNLHRRSTWRLHRTTSS